MDTIFALSSGAPPAAIGVIRISGPKAADALRQLGGILPAPRTVRLTTLKDKDAAILDRALVIWFPGPASATGEDCAEIHCHGGRAVIEAIGAALTDIDGLRAAEAGEFTRRSFANGKLDLAEAEGLADLLSAETELQRVIALEVAGGAVSRQLLDWRRRILELASQVEGVLDFSDEEDAVDLPPSFHTEKAALTDELAEWERKPRIERLRDGVRVVLAGPPNAGKSTLFNALLRSEAAIVSPYAGTTRDVIERPVAIDGVPVVLVDTAGIRANSEDAIERIGIDRAQTELERADIVLWLGEQGCGPRHAWEVETRADLGSGEKSDPDFRVSGLNNEGVDELSRALANTARRLLPSPGQGAVNERQAKLLSDARSALEARYEEDPLILAEHLRSARLAFDRLLGNASTEDMLDTLFGRFCIGK